MAKSVDTDQTAPVENAAQGKCSKISNFSLSVLK